MIENVIEFNRDVLGLQPRAIGEMPDHEFKHLSQCLTEEIFEFQESYDKSDFIGQIDSLIDLIYFAYGGLYKMGLSAEVVHKISDAVHDANMKKRKGVIERRGDGRAADAVKPKNWVSPETRIMEILDKETV